VRIATLYDVHGNLAALEAVLNEIPDDVAIVVGGDVCAGGSHPSETLERLRSLGERVHWLRGNGDRELTPGEIGLGPADVMEATRRALTAEQIAFLYRLSPTVQIGRVLFCHATPRNDLDISPSGRPRSESPVSSPRSMLTSSSAVIRTRSSSARLPGSASSTPAASAGHTRTRRVPTGRSTSNIATRATPLRTRRGSGGRKQSSLASRKPFSRLLNFLRLRRSRDGAGPKRIRRAPPPGQS
jgi:Calcineurin-like phosphoesterase